MPVHSRQLSARSKATRAGAWDPLSPLSSRRAARVGAGRRVATAVLNTLGMPPSDDLQRTEDAPDELLERAKPDVCPPNCPGINGVDHDCLHPAVMEEKLLSNMSEVPTLPAEMCSCDDCVAVMVRFKWDGSWGANQVSLAGSFNNWEEIPIERSPNGDFVLALTLEPGTYQYKFKVDGRWLTSLEEPRVGDENNNLNNQVTVAEAVTYKWKKKWGGSVVYVSGTDSNWTERSRLEEDDEGNFILRKSLRVGTYHYKFFVDGEWRCSPEEPTQRNDKNCLNNVVTVAADASVTLYYKTGWNLPRVHIPNGVESFSEVPMGHGPSEGWMRVSVPASPGYLQRRALGATMAYGKLSRKQVPAHAVELAAMSEHDAHQNGREEPALEFSISNGDGEHDLPPGGGLYTCPHPGGYKLMNGQLIPFPRARRPPVMVVSDLDGTMVGSDAHFDAGTKAFKDYWDDCAGLAGGVLAYNTGRSIGQAASLFVEKKDLLAVPNVIITAVGTKIFERNKLFPPETLEGWTEDSSYSKELDQGWDLDEVRASAEVLVNVHHGACHWLDRGTEHPHRCSLSVELNLLDTILESLKDSFQKKNLQVKVIVSGVGDWRYVDCVASRAGKLEALEYVRRKWGVPKERCAACGDSGNDVLMLEGENPAIVVANAQPDLVDWVLNQPQTGRVVLSDAKGAMGILEGLASLSLF